MLSETKVALPQLSAFIDPATALTTADAYDNDVEDEEGSSPDATGLLDLTLGRSDSLRGRSNGEASGPCLVTGHG